MMTRAVFSKGIFSSSITANLGKAAGGRDLKRRWEDRVRASPASPVDEASSKDDEDSLKATPPVGDVAEVAADRGLRIARARPADGEGEAVAVEIHQKPVNATC